MFQAMVVTLQRSVMVRQGEEFVKANLDQHVEVLKLHFLLLNVNPAIFDTNGQKLGMNWSENTSNWYYLCVCDLVLRFLQQSWFNGN